MSTSFRYWGIALCSICRDQLYDFAWVSVVQVVVWLFGVIDGYMFVIEEILLFVVLVIVKHQFGPPWESDNHAT